MPPGPRATTSLLHRARDVEEDPKEKTGQTDHGLGSCNTARQTEVSSPGVMSGAHTHIQ